MRPATLCLAPPGRESPHGFTLLSAGKIEQATGTVNLIPAWSPFGLAVSVEGSFIYDLEITVSGLPAPQELGAYTTYVAWMTTPGLERVENLGVIGNGNPLKVTADWNKMMIVISAENAPNGSQWAGTILLSGRSPSARLENFANHDLFNTGNTLC